MPNHIAGRKVCENQVSRYALPGEVAFITIPGIIVFQYVLPKLLLGGSKP